MDDATIKCQKCGSENLAFSVDVLVYAPIKHFHKLSKKSFEDKELRLWGAEWSRCSIFCRTCGYTKEAEKVHDLAGIVEHEEA